MLSFTFPPCLQARLTDHKGLGVLACVCACVHVRVPPPVNPFCQVSVQPFLSKLPAWSRSPLCWWEEWEEKAFGTPVAPSPSPGPFAHEGRAWDLLRAGALYGSCDWRFNRLSLGHPCIPFHTSETGEKDNYTHIQQPRPLCKLHLWCTATSQIYKPTANIL